VPEDWRSYVDDYWRNWREYDGSFGRKLALAAKNRVIANVRGCCGNFGEPGC
jgi:hypothetical protein